jgi:hypothetical protein
MMEGWKQSNSNLICCIPQQEAQQLVLNVFLLSFFKLVSEDQEIEASFSASFTTFLN